MGLEEVAASCFINATDIWGSKINSRETLELSQQSCQTKMLCMAELLPFLLFNVVIASTAVVMAALDCMQIYWR